MIAEVFIIRGLKVIFDGVNEDCKKSGESVVKYSDTEYYSQQIQNLLECSNKKAARYAIKLSQL